MAKKDTIEIVSIEQVQTVAQLRDNIKGLKDQLNEANIGSKEYQDTLSALKVNQNALKDAMYATSGGLQDVTKAATGATQSYNGLVHRMAALKEELRATDVSTEAGAARFKELAGQVNAVNDQLKAMDALQGNYQRNVGNYQSAFKGLAGGIDALGKGFKIAQGSAEGLKGGFDALAASPVMATIGIVATLAVKLAGALKEDEGATQAVKKAMDALQPVMDFFSALLDKVVGILAQVIDKVVAFVSSNGLIQKVIQGVVGVGNAIAQFVISPFKAVIAAVKVFQDEGVKGLGNAARAFGQEMKEGVSFKANFLTGQAFADTLIAGAKSRTPKAKAEARAAGKDIADELAAAIEAEIGDTDITIDPIAAASSGGGKKGSNGLADIDEATKRRRDLAALEIEDAQERADELYKIEQEGLRKRIELLKLYAEETTDPQEWLDAQQQIADAEYEIWFNTHQKELEDERNKEKARADLMKQAVATTSSLLSSLADAYEASAGDSAKSAARVKALRVASATIDTISGAIGAYMQAVQTIPPPAGAIVGAAQAAAITAAGVAQIAKMKSTQIEGAGGSGSAGAAVSAPAFTPQMTSVRSIASNSEEMRMENIAKKQRVYIVASDIEASLEERRTTVEEATF